MDSVKFSEFPTTLDAFDDHELVKRLTLDGKSFGYLPVADHLNLAEVERALYMLEIPSERNADQVLPKEDNLADLGKTFEETQRIAPADPTKTEAEKRRFIAGDGDEVRWPFFALKMLIPAPLLQDASDREIFGSLIVALRILFSFKKDSPEYAVLAYYVMLVWNTGKVSLADVEKVTVHNQRDLHVLQELLETKE